MARGNNANNKLYKMLHEEYELELSVDFWLHPQSGSYIISHNAVKKIVAKQHERGLIIETPMGETLICYNDGTKEGIFGKEVVYGGNFYLKNSDGVVLRKVYMKGEVNKQNCKIAYPHTMAYKRLYDRGVLALLQMGQEGLYSDVEADTFKQKASQKPAEKKAPEEVAAAPKPQLPPPPTSMPKISPPSEKKTPMVTAESSIEFRIMNIMIENSEGTSKSEIWNMLPNDKEEINSAIDKLMKDGKIIKTGERRGTKYHVNSGETEPATAPLTQVQYNNLWRDASEELRAKGLEYNQIMNIVQDITGHTTAISAFKSGELTKEHLEMIKQKGAQLGT
jgi:hypothetical protein